ncbi:MAG: hypothetical protein QM757_15945 [Paludibaculum sp.]
MQTTAYPTNETYLDNSELVLNMGPQHPSTHGVLRVVLKLDGETGRGTDCIIGYLHRGIEKIAERPDLHDSPPMWTAWTMSPLSPTLGYCLAVEKLISAEAPPRAQAVQRDPDGAEPDREPPVVARHPRARYRRHHPAVLHHA